MGQDNRLHCKASPYINHHDEASYIMLLIPSVEDDNGPIWDVISFVNIVFGSTVRDT
jgi:hypothetical protein